MEKPIRITMAIASAIPRDHPRMATVYTPMTEHTMPATVTVAMMETQMLCVATMRTAAGGNEGGGALGVADAEEAMGQRIGGSEVRLKGRSAHVPDWYVKSRKRAL